MKHGHDFHSAEYVKSWAATVNERRPQRAVVFDYMAGLVAARPGPQPHVVELACGPGMLAEVLLAKNPHITYEALDYSLPMLELARERLAPFADRVRFHQADLLTPGWTTLLSERIDAVVSCQALHDLRSEDAIREVYYQAHRLLSGGGLLVNADLIAETEEAARAKPGRLTLARQVELLRAEGFVDVTCELQFADYGCVVAHNPPA